MQAGHSCWETAGVGATIEERPAQSAECSSFNVHPLTDIHVVFGWTKEIVYQETRKLNSAKPLQLQAVRGSNSIEWTSLFRAIGWTNEMVYQETRKLSSDKPLQFQAVRGSHRIEWVSLLCTTQDHPEKLPGYQARDSAKSDSKPLALNATRSH